MDPVERLVAVNIGKIQIEQDHILLDEGERKSFFPCRSNTHTRAGKRVTQLRLQESRRASIVLHDEDAQLCERHPWRTIRHGVPEK